MSQESTTAQEAFVPREELVTILCSLGVSRNAAIRALFHTGNSSADLAAMWVFENQDKDLDNPLSEGFATSEDDIEEFSGNVPTYKMVFIVNSSLNMGVGKVAGQVGHAAVGLYKQLIERQQEFGEMLLFWSQFGETKIVLKGQNASQLLELFSKAESLGLPAFCVHDAGRTEVTPGSLTVVAIMGNVETVNKVSGNLPLL